MLIYLEKNQGDDILEIRVRISVRNTLFNMLSNWNVNKKVT